MAQTKTPLDTKFALTLSPNANMVTLLDELDDDECMHERKKCLKRWQEFFFAKITLEKS
jgi:hypothetical protein